MQTGRSAGPKVDLLRVCSSQTESCMTIAVFGFPNAPYFGATGRHSLICDTARLSPSDTLCCHGRHRKALSDSSASARRRYGRKLPRAAPVVSSAEGVGRHGALRQGSPRRTKTAESARLAQGGALRVSHSLDRLKRRQNRKQRGQGYRCLPQRSTKTP